MKWHFQGYGQCTNWLSGLVSQKLCKDGLETRLFRLKTALKH